MYNVKSRQPMDGSAKKLRRIGNFEKIGYRLRRNEAYFRLQTRQVHHLWRLTLDGALRGHGAFWYLQVSCCSNQIMVVMAVQLIKAWRYCWRRAFLSRPLLRVMSGRYRLARRSGTFRGGWDLVFISRCVRARFAGALVVSNEYVIPWVSNRAYSVLAVQYKLAYSSTLLCFLNTALMQRSLSTQCSRFFTHDECVMVSAPVSWQFSDMFIAFILVLMNFLLFCVAYVSCTSWHVYSIYFVYDAFVIVLCGLRQTYIGCLHCITLAM